MSEEVNIHTHSVLEMHSYLKICIKFRTFCIQRKLVKSKSREVCHSLIQLWNQRYFRPNLQTYVSHENNKHSNSETKALRLAEICN